MNAYAAYERRFPACFHDPTYDSARAEQLLLGDGRALADTARDQHEHPACAMMWVARQWRSRPDALEQRVQAVALACLEQDATAAESALYDHAVQLGYTHPDEVRGLIDDLTAALRDGVREAA